MREEFFELIGFDDRVFHIFSVYAQSHFSPPALMGRRCLFPFQGVVRAQWLP